MPYRLKYTQTAFSLIAHFPPELKKLFREALQELQDNPALGKFLKDELGGYQYLSRRRYRIIYKTDNRNKTVWVYFAGHRKDIYELFRAHIEKG